MFTSNHALLSKRTLEFFFVVGFFSKESLSEITPLAKNRVFYGCDVLRGNPVYPIPRCVRSAQLNRLKDYKHVFIIVDRDKNCRVRR